MAKVRCSYPKCKAYGTCGHGMKDHAINDDCTNHNCSYHPRAVCKPVDVSDDNMAIDYIVMGLDKHNQRIRLMTTGVHSIALDEYQRCVNHLLCGNTWAKFQLIKRSAKLTEMCAAERPKKGVSNVGSKRSSQRKG